MKFRSQFFLFVKKQYKFFFLKKQSEPCERIPVWKSEKKDRGLDSVPKYLCDYGQAQHFSTLVSKQNEEKETIDVINLPT